MTVLVLRVLICGAAAYRIARAITVDTITAPVRRTVFGWGYPQGPKGPRIHPWDYLYGLISCPYCCGFWLSLLAWWLWSLGGFAVTTICAVAVAGVAAQLSSYDKAAS